LEDAAQAPASQLAAALRELYEAAGEPDPSVLRQQGQAQKPPVNMASSTVSDWLHGKSVPSGTRAFWFFVDYLQPKASQRSNYGQRSHSEWKEMLRQANKRRGSGRGGRPARDSAPAPLPGGKKTVSLEVPGRKASEWDPYLLGVKRSAESGSPGTGLPAYVQRDLDPVFRASLQDMSLCGGFVVLVGEPATGKSRTAYEAVQAVMPDWTLVRARTPQDLMRAAVADASSRVIWLDDMSRLLGAYREDLPADFVRLIGSRRPVVIIGMLWPSSYDRYAGQEEADQSGAYAGSLPPVPSAAKEVLGLARVMHVPEELSNSERERAEEAADHDAQISSALAVDEFGLFQTLAGTPELLRRWRSGDPAGAAVITAAVDARLLGATEPLERKFLEEAAPGYIPPARLARLVTSWETRALAYATAQVDGACAALSPVAGDAPGAVAGYAPADVLVRAGQEQRRFAPVPERTWRALLAHVSDSSSLARIGWSAEWRLLYELAHEFYTVAGPDGAVRRARLLVRQGRLAEARQVLSPLVAHGDQAAGDELRHLAAQISDPDERATVLKGISSARPGKSGDLGRELESQGRIDEAIAAWSGLARNGDTRAATRAAGLLDSAGRAGEAITLLQACSGDDSSARFMLADFLVTAGRTDEAESLLRAWTANGDETAARGLAHLLHESGRNEDLTALAEAGNRDAQRILIDEWADGASEQADLAEKAVAASRRWFSTNPLAQSQVLRKLGQIDQALTLMTAIEQQRGRNDDLNALISNTLLRAGRLSELQDRADSGDTRAQGHIATQLAVERDLDGLAAHARRGNYSAWVKLSEIAEGEAEIDQAVELWRQAISAGHDFGKWGLIDLLRKNDRDYEIVALLEDAPITCGKLTGRTLGYALVGTGQIARLTDRANAGDPYADEALTWYLASKGHWAVLCERAAAGSGAATRELLSNDTLPRRDEIERYGLRPDGSIATPGNNDSELKAKIAYTFQ
jgi:Tetratricopeptide repeat